jgi:hypothetical protein
MICETRTRYKLDVNIAQHGQALSLAVYFKVIIQATAQL